MKKPLLIILLLLAAFFTNAQSSWQWAKQANYCNPQHSDEAMGVATDDFNNLYMVGYYQDSVMIFGSDTLVNSSAVEEGYLAKYDANGNAIWGRRIGGGQPDAALDVVTDASGNVFVTGQFESVQMILGADTLHSAGADDIFIAKYDPSGNVVWAKSYGGTSSDIGECITTDTAGNLYLSGFINSPVITFDSITLNASLYKRMFLAKFTPNGNVIWAQNPLNDGPYVTTKKHSTDKAGNIYVAAHPPISTGPYELAKFSSAGNLIWTQPMIAVNDNMSVKVDSFGSVYVVGFFYYSSATFDTVTFYNSSLILNQQGDMFLVKYDTAGNFRWARRTTGNEFEWGTAVSVDGRGSVHIGGMFTSAVVHFDGITITKQDSTSKSIFLAEYDSAGIIQTVVSTVNIGGYNVSHGICNDALNNTYLAGSYSSDSIYFGTQEMINPVGHNLQADRSFLAKYSADMTTAVAPIAFTRNNDVIVYPNPGKGLFRVRSGRVIKMIEVIDPQGRMVFTEQISSTNAKIDLTQYASGIYYCKITAEGGPPSILKLIAE